MTEKKSIQRCAVYTRKSTEEGLDMDFNSLQAQREACEAYITSQKGEGWRLVKTPYDDGGISGGTMERPALQRLLQDIETGEIDVVVVYKVDRLTRSLHDFSKMVEVFDRKGASFVAVTQQFNTTTSMGRLTLNVLLSFAQFEREVTAERIRDKFAASKSKGIWMGGVVPYGYEVMNRKLYIVKEKALEVERIYRMYLEVSSVRELSIKLRKQKVISQMRGDKPMYFHRGPLYTLLRNPIYVGLLPHKGKVYPGEHEALLPKELWDEVQAKMNASLKCRGIFSRKTEESPLRGKVFDERGRLLTITYGNKAGKHYRYYTTHPDDQDEDEVGGVQYAGWRLRGPELEEKVVLIVDQMVGDRVAMMRNVAEAGMPPIEAEQFIKECQGATRKEKLDWVKSIKLAGNQLAVSVLLPHSAELPLEKTVSMVMRKRGVEQRLIIEGTAPRKAADPNIVKVLSLGLRFWEYLNASDENTAMQFAKAVGIDNRHLGRMLPLAFTAPALMEACMAGMQPETLNAQALVRWDSLPLSWMEQGAAWLESSV